MMLDKLVAFDTETTGLHVEKVSLIGAAFYTPESSFFVEKLNGYEVEILTDKDFLKVMHNATFDTGIMLKYGIEVSPRIDTMVLAHLLQYKELSLKALAYDVLGVDILDYTAFHKMFSSPSLSRWGEYSLQQVGATYWLAQNLYPKVKARKLDRLFSEILMPVVPIISKMELAGVQIDVNQLAKAGEEFTKALQLVKASLKSHLGYDINPNSPPQVAKTVYDKLGLPRPYKISKSGGSPTDKKTLEKHKGNPVVSKILEYRSYSQLISTFIEGIFKNLHNGRIHTRFNICGTRTGRLSSSEPNLQNIPVRTDLGKMIRKAFVAKEGHELFVVDWDQLELRMMAHFSQDSQMLKVFRSPVGDIHQSTTDHISELHGDRFRGKTLNFTLGYLSEVWGIAEGLGVPKRRAQIIRDEWFKAYEGYANWVHKQELHIRDEMYVRTLHGRVRSFPEIQYLSQWDRTVQGYIKDGINTIVQGSSAEIVELAMIRLDKVLPASVRMLLQVHDELIIESPLSEHDLVLEVLETYAPYYELSLPFTVTIKYGCNWVDTIEVKGSKERQYEQYARWNKE